MTPEEVAVLKERRYADCAPVILTGDKPSTSHPKEACCQVFASERASPTGLTHAVLTHAVLLHSGA